MPSEASSPPLWGGGPRGHSRSPALCGAQQLLVNEAARLLWVSYPRWVQLLLLRYSFSSGFKSKGRLGDGGGGVSFLINNPPGKAYLGQGSRRNKTSRFLVQ